MKEVWFIFVLLQLAGKARNLLVLMINEGILLALVLSPNQDCDSLLHDAGLP
jgi:hypothetical protein